MVDYCNLPIMRSRYKLYTNTQTLTLSLLHPIQRLKGYFIAKMRTRKWK